jgi:MarR family 2-MHQ and catechol resistance regulon transcriptional repressor
VKHLYIKINEKKGHMTERTEPRTAAVHLWLVLWKAARALEAYARQDIKDLGICQSDFGVLEALLHKGPLAVNALGAKVLLTSGSITTAIDRLEQKQLVVRRSDPGDRRARVVHLTSKGERVIRKLFAEHEKAIERAVVGLSTSERKHLTDLLRKLGRGLGSSDRQRGGRAKTAVQG